MNLENAFLELNKLYESTELNESTWLDRDTIIDNIKSSGKQYNFEKYSDEQLYRIWQRIQNSETTYSHLEVAPERAYDYCDRCDCRKTDGGNCPVCDDGAEDINVAWESLLKESKELSTEHAVNSVVDQVKSVYEAGLFSRLPVGRKNAFTIEITGPDKERLTGYFKKQLEFNYDMARFALTARLRQN